MSVLPISEELNDILVQVLEIDWTARISLIDLRAAVDGVSSFYADHVIFEGGLARCPWEAGVDFGNGTADKPLAKKRPYTEENCTPHPRGDRAVLCLLRGSYHEPRESGFDHGHISSALLAGLS